MVNIALAVFLLIPFFKTDGSAGYTFFPGQHADTTIIRLADPAILFHQGNYYLYGTGGNVNNGFLVYTSADLKTWKGPSGATDGYALTKGDAYGTKGFWAPQVFYRDKKFYMAYTADENIAIAESGSPLGPFKQKEIKAISGQGKQIDPYVFFDDNGKKYLYHVRLTEGNRLFVAELNDDLSDIKPQTVQLCLAATDQPWENTANSRWPVSEGPTVLKHKSLYYLFYSANDFRNVDYAVGYAVSDNAIGPWKKYEKNPVISRKNMGVNGTGHGDFLKDKSGNLVYVFHTHNTDSVVSPRLTAVVKGKFVADTSNVDRMRIDEKSFHFLHLTPKRAK
ncbi:MAG: glycoside hydrolase family 43 protein [Chitinophagaceae bacterium]